MDRNFMYSQFTTSSTTTATTVHHRHYQHHRDNGVCSELWSVGFAMDPVLPPSPSPSLQLHVPGVVVQGSMALRQVNVWFCSRDHLCKMEMRVVCRCSVFRARPVYGDCSTVSPDVRCWRRASLRPWSSPRIAPCPPWRHRLVYGRLWSVRGRRAPRLRRQYRDAAVFAGRARPGNQRPTHLQLRVARGSVRDGCRRDALRHVAAWHRRPAADVSVGPGRVTDQGDSGQDDVWRNGDQGVCSGRRHWTVCPVYYRLP